MSVLLLTDVFRGPLTFWLSLPLLSCEIPPACRDLVRIVEEVYGFELIDLYRKVLEDSLKCEISKVLTLEDLTRERLAECVLIFLSRLVESNIISKCASIVKTLSKFCEDSLRRVYNEVLNYLVKRVVGEFRYMYSEDVVYAISVLFDRDLWVVSRVRRLSVKGLVSVLRRRVCSRLERFNDVSINLAFTVVSTLAGLLQVVPMSVKESVRRENIDRLARWSRKLAEDLSELMELLDSVLMGELDPDSEAMHRLEAARYFLEEAERMLSEARSVEDPYLRRIHLAQVCEKLYKVAEECVKALAVKYRLHQQSELREIMKLRRWDTSVLNRSVLILSKELSRKEPALGRLISHAWFIAYTFLHVEGFHELKKSVLDVNFVENIKPDVEELLRKTEELLRQ